MNGKVNGMRRALLGAIGCLLLLPAAAEAAKVRSASDFATVVEYRADRGDTDVVTISLSGRRTVEFRSDSAPLEAGKGCRDEGGDDVVRCPLRGPDADQVPSGFPDGIGRLVGPVLISLDLGNADDAADASALPRGFRFRGERSELVLLANGGDGNDLLAGGAGDDQFFGSLGDDAVAGGGGADSFVPLPRPDGADSFDGGAGRDFVDFGARDRSVSVSPDGVANDGAAGEGDSIVSAEFIFGGAGDDVLMGSDGPNFIVGEGGDDQITGGDGGDSLLGDFLTRSGGDDRIDAGDGNDLAFGGLGRDVLLAGAGNDEVEARSSEGNRGRDQRDRVDCGAGEDDARAQDKDRLTACENVRRGG